MYIKRHIENALKTRAEMYSAVIVTGPRQVGKSTMLKTVMSGIPYVTLDNLAVRTAASESPSMFFKTYEPPVIVDEIQYEPRLLSDIKIIADGEKKKGQFYLTGSQAFDLMKGVSESLSGRIGILELSGLSYRELCGIEYMKEFYPTTEHIDAMKTLTPALNYKEIAGIIQKGSYPVIYEKDYNAEQREIFYSDYIATYIERDVSRLTQVADKSAFTKFITAAASLTGQMLNMTTLADICGKEVNTVKRWLSIIETSGLIFILEPYYEKTAKRLTRTPKIYFLDTGLACWLCGWNTPEQLMRGAMSGRMFETYVVSEILKSYKNAGKKGLKQKFSYYRDFDGKEIDLIIDGGDVLHPIEIKLSANPQKSDISAFYRLERFSKPVGEGGVICMCDTPLYLAEKFRTIPVNMI